MKRHIIIKLLKVSNKEKNLKSIQSKKTHYIQGNKKEKNVMQNTVEKSLKYWGEKAQ